MIVLRSTFNDAIHAIKVEPCPSLDTETTGLRPYHGDRIFSVIIATAHCAYYFNFQAYPDLTKDEVLGPDHMKRLS